MGNPSNALLLGGLWLVWGYTWVLTKQGLLWMGPLEFATVRIVLALGALGAVLLFTGRPLRPPPWRPTLALGLTQTAGFTGLSSLALVGGGAGKVSVLAYTMPFWVLPMAWFWLGERPSRGQWGAVGVAALGLLAILEPWQGKHAWLSDGLAVGCGIAWAASAVIAKRLRATHRVDVLSLTFWQMVWGAWPLLGLMLIFPGKPTVWNAELVVALGFAGILAAGLGWLIWLVLLSRLSAGTAALNVLIIPAVAVLAAWLQLGERPSPFELTGMVLIALALLRLAWLAGHTTPAPAAPSPAAPKEADHE